MLILYINPFYSTAYNYQKICQSVRCFCKIKINKLANLLAIVYSKNTLVNNCACEYTLKIEVDGDSLCRLKLKQSCFLISINLFLRKLRRYIPHFLN